MALSFKYSLKRIVTFCLGVMLVNVCGFVLISVGGISSTGPPSGLRTDAQLFSIIIAIINKILLI